MGSQETPAERAKRLQREAKMAALEQIRLLADALEVVVGSAEAVAEHDMQPPGARDLARRLADDIRRQQTALAAAVKRHWPDQG